MARLGLGEAIVKVWASLRWSHLQAIIPAELSFVEGRLAAATVLRRTKTSGPNRVKELPVAISEHAFFLSCH